MTDRPWLSQYPEGVPADIDTTHYRSLVELMEESFGKYADRTAYSFMGKDVSYADTDAASRALAAYFQGLGLLLGDPLMELRLAGPMNGLVNYLRDKVEVVTHGEDWVRYTVPDPLHFNPALLSELARQSTPVVTLSEIPRSLEEVYLQIVESDQKLEDALKETGEKPFE